MDHEEVNVQPLVGWRRKFQNAGYGLFRFIFFIVGLRVETVGEQVQKNKERQCKRHITQI